MTTLIACLGNEKGTREHVVEIVNKEKWDKVFIICENKPNDFSDKNQIDYCIINSGLILKDLAEEIICKLQNKVNDIEVAINLVSGSGKLHMALLSALLKLGLGIRLIALTKEGVKEV